MSKKKKAEESLQKEVVLEEETQEEQVQTEEAQWQDKYLRILAEFDNYKKRTNREREQLYADASIDAISNILPVLDNLQRAVAVEVAHEEAKCVLEGVEALKRQLEEILKQMGISAIEAVGKEFDPQLHNAVMHIDDENYGTNIVVEEFSTGYQYKEKVIRHSMVKVAN